MDKARAVWVELLPRLAPMLPPDLFGRLRASPYPSPLSAEAERGLADDIEQTIRTLSSLHHTLTNFLPRYLLDLAPTPGEPHGELLEGSFIFADVTGFTALTTELSKHGSQGLEEMNRLMCALFGALLDPLLDSGGDLLIFAGDAVLACFPALPDQPAGQDARWAARTALRLVESISDFAHIQTPYGDFSLTMSAGVDRGLSFATVVGSRKRMELLISGGPVQAAMRAEGEGEAREVIAGPGVRPFLRPEEFILQGNVVAGIQSGELDDYEPVPPVRRRHLATILSRRIPDLVEHLQYALAQVELLAIFLPPAIFAQIAQGQDFRQHPPVAIQFVNILGAEALALGPVGPERITSALQRYFIQAQEIVTDRQGIVNQMDPYAQGFTFINPFGAPTHHEGVPRLAASAALELARALDRINREFDLSPPLTQRTGLTFDRIFTGEIGYRHRREYVIAGPAVNLAARLMSKAELGQIVLDPAAWKAVQADFLADPLPPIPLKGIPEPVPRFALQGIRRGRAGASSLTDYPLTGREDELAALMGRLEDARAGQGGSALLVGDAGIGKSRLAAALASVARQQGMDILDGRCRPFARTTPYAPWVDLVSHWFELPEDASPEDRRRRLVEQLARFDLSASFPAFVDLLGLPSVDLISRADRLSAQAEGPRRSIFAVAQQQAEQEPTKASTVGGWSTLTQRATWIEGDPTSGDRASLWDVLRERASIPQALHLALERQALRQPTLVIIEDIQWMDAESRIILEAVSAAASMWPLFFLTTARPDVEGWGGERIPLSPLSKAGSRELASLALRATRLEPDLADWLLAQVDGNSLFILSYCRALQDADAVVVDPVSGEARWSGPPPDLPLTLHDTLLAQVDRLSHESQEAIRHGAVIGTTFPTWLLANLCREVLPADQLSGPLDQASRRGLISPPPPAPAHAFSSHSLHEAVYATLSHAQRQIWHEQAGDYLAQADDPTRYERLEQIAYHYSRSGDPYKAAHFTRLAGDKARARRANEAALSIYAQTLAVVDGERVAVEQRLAHESSGDVHALRGDGEAARAAYQAAYQAAWQDGSLADGDEDTRRLRAKLALVAPMIEPTDPNLLEGACDALFSSNPLRPWLDAAWIWLQAERGETEDAIARCRDLLPQTGEPVRALLKEAQESLENGIPLRPYADFFAVLAHFCLRP